MTGTKPPDREGVRSFRIEGMTCASCVNRVESAIAGVDGVERAEVNLGTETATVWVSSDSGGAIDNAIAHAAGDAGYNAIAIKDPLDLPNASADERGKQWNIRTDLLISALFSIPAVVSGMLGMFHGIRDSDVVKFFNPQVTLLSSAIVVLFAGRQFFKGAWKALLRRTSDMNTLIAVGAGVTFAYSAMMTLTQGDPHGHGPHVYYETAVIIITLVLLGRTIETRARRLAANALVGLLALRPRQARIVRNGIETLLATDMVVPGDTLVLRPGDQVPVDGIVGSGTTTIDESMLTGESLPVTRRPGDRVAAGTLNIDGSVEFTATAVGSDTLLSSIARMVARAQSSKQDIQLLVDRIAAKFVPAVIAVSALTFLGWLTIGQGGVSDAMMRAIAVLMTACPCALGLATPMAVIVGIGTAARSGILIRDPDTLQKLASIDTVVFDKTGTITEGRMNVREFRPGPGVDRGQVLRFAASVEYRSEHPVASAVVALARSEQLEIPKSDEFLIVPGQGARGIVQGNTVRVGTAEFCGVQADPTVADDSVAPVYISVNGAFAGVFLIEDTIRIDAQAEVSTLGMMNIEVMLMSGDRNKNVMQSAKIAGIGQVFSERTPEQKGAEVAALVSGGRRVAVVGDGINDAPALASASVGLAMGSGTDIAKESADVVLLSSSLRAVSTSIRLARSTVGAIKQNLAGAFIYNLLAIPLAAFGYLHPILAAAAMSLSSLTVVGNSLRLRSALSRKAG